MLGRWAIETLPEYDARAIEERRQRQWSERDAFRTPRLSAEQSGVYIKASAPFTSGNVHIGHVRSYAIGDAYARFQRARGEPVLFAFGFDAFGLPAELGAIANGESPSEWVTRCAEHMTGQLRRLGFSFDWERTFMSSDAVMYRWSQWLFLTLLEAGLIYHGTGTVDWCDTCQTTLATIQVEDGRCWRCHNPVRLIQRPQWYLRVSAYVEENDRRLAELAEMGRDVAGEPALRARPGRRRRARGPRARTGGELTVFTPYGDGLEQARFVLMSPKHPEVERWAAGAEVREQLEEMRLGGWERSSRAAETIALVDTGRALTLPGDERSLPVLISPVVDERFGATAVLGVPELDRTDALIAQRIPGIEPDVAVDGGAARRRGGAAGEKTQPTRSRGWRRRERDRVVEAARRAPRAGRGRAHGRALPRERLLDLAPARVGHADPDRLLRALRDGADPARAAAGAAAAGPETDGRGQPAGRARGLRAHDLPELRRCGAARDGHAGLPLRRAVAVGPGVRAGRGARAAAGGDPRAARTCARGCPRSASWRARTAATSCSTSASRRRRCATSARSRSCEQGEPFAGALMHEMVIRDGRKMSKHLGNVVDPDELVESVRRGHGAPGGAVGGAPAEVAELERQRGAVLQPLPAQPLEVLAGALRDGRARTLRSSTRYSTEFLRKRLEKWCEIAVEKITEDLANLEMHKAVRNVIRLLDRIKDFETRVVERSGALCREDHEALLDALALMATVLAPFAPHIAQELLLSCGRDGTATDPPWPRPSTPAQESGAS